MPKPKDTSTILTLHDIELCCQKWRNLGADDDTQVVIKGDRVAPIIAEFTDEGYVELQKQSNIYAAWDLGT